MVTPLSISVAALLTQLCYVGILAFGIFRSDETSVIYARNEDMTFSTLYGLLVLTLLLTVVPMVLTPELARAGSAAFGNLALPSISLSRVLVFVFGVNIIITSAMIGGTGGFMASSLTPALLTLPALAIFLRQSFTSVGLYLCIIVVVAKVSLEGRQLETPSHAQARATFWVTTLSLILTTFIGYATRPQ